MFFRMIRRSFLSEDEDVLVGMEVAIGVKIKRLQELDQGKGTLLFAVRFLLLNP